MMCVPWGCILQTEGEAEASPFLSEPKNSPHSSESVNLLQAKPLSILGNLGSRTLLSQNVSENRLVSLLISRYDRPFAAGNSLNFDFGDLVFGDLVHGRLLCFNSGIKRQFGGKEKPYFNYFQFFSILFSTRRSASSITALPSFTH